MSRKGRNDMSEIEQLRVAAYAEAIRDRIKALTPPPVIGTGGGLSLGATEFDMARAVVAVADAENERLRAEVERLRRERDTAQEWFEAADAAADRRLDQSIKWMKRAEAAEAKLRDPSDPIVCSHGVPASDRSHSCAAVLARSQDTPTH